MCCNTCPFAFTNESEQVQNYGCLPTPFEIIQVLKKHGAVWGCHCTSKEEGNLTVCKGLLKAHKYHKNIEIPLITGNEEIVDYSQWADDTDYYLRFKL